MFVVRPPSRRRVEDLLKRAGTLNYSYPEVGATRDELPRGYAIDHNRVQLGRGAETFRKAVSALRSWQMFNLGWLRVHDDSAPLVVGSTVAVVIRHFGFSSINVSRIVYVIDEERRFGFAYGTLTDHAERGEERFSVEWDRTNDGVFYDVLSFSKPQQWQVQIAQPIARRLQKKFARDSMMAMKWAVLKEIHESRNP